MLSPFFPAQCSAYLFQWTGVGRGGGEAKSILEWPALRHDIPVDCSASHYLGYHISQGWRAAESRSLARLFLRDYFTRFFTLCLFSPDISLKLLFVPGFPWCYPSCRVSLVLPLLQGFPWCSSSCKGSPGGGPLPTLLHTSSWQVSFGVPLPPRDNLALLFLTGFLWGSSFCQGKIDSPLPDRVSFGVPLPARDNLTLLFLTGFSLVFLFLPGQIWLPYSW